MKYLLFVDDEPNVLEALERMLYPMQREWHMAFAGSGAEALAHLDETHFDIVVTDMRMPGMDGAELLAAVKKRHPDTLRFILTGQSDNEIVYRSVGEAHQFLGKPCKPALLKECVDRALGLRNLLESDALKQVVAEIDALPPIPRVYAALCEKLRSPEATAPEVGCVMEEDPAITAKMLQLVNSALFGLRQHVSSAAQAVALLGFDTTKALVLMSGLFAHAESRSLPSRFSFERLWRHGAQVAAYAQAIARAEEFPRAAVNDAYTAGVLHDCGELVLAAACQDDFAHSYDFAMVNEVSPPEAEKAVLGCTHAEIGAYLLGIWGLPYDIVEAVAYHHRPAQCCSKGFTAVAAVHVADAFAWEEESGTVDYPLPQADIAYLSSLGLADRLPQWKNACEKLAKERM